MIIWPRPLVDPKRLHRLDHLPLILRRELVVERQVGAAHRMELKCVVIESLTSAELGLALGRENVIHAAVQPGGLAERLIFDAERLSGFRPRTESRRAQARGEKE